MINTTKLKALLQEKPASQIEDEYKASLNWISDHPDFMGDCGITEADIDSMWDENSKDVMIEGICDTFDGLGDTDLGNAFLSYMGYDEEYPSAVEESVQEADENGEETLNSVVGMIRSASSMEALVKILNKMTPNQLNLLETGFGNGTQADKMETKVDNIPASMLHPTQNEIDLTKSLEYPLTKSSTEDVKKILEDGPVKIMDYIVVYNYKNTYYIIDGHHRWSQACALNPDCAVASLIFQNSAGDKDQDPIDMLRDFQGAIAVANHGKVPSATVSGQNLLTMDLGELREYVVNNCSDACLKAFNEVFNEGKGDVTKEVVAEIISDNVNIMQKKNKPVAGACARDWMPQLDTKGALDIAKVGMTDI